jgi:hypothetical protein
MQRRNGKKSTHLLAWIHAWQLGAQGRVPACSAAHLHHNVPLGQGLGPPGELLLLLLLSVNLLPAALVRERAGVGITAGGGVVGGQGEGGGRDAAGAVAEPAEEGAGAAAHKNRAPWALDARDLRGARRFGRGWEGTGWCREGGEACGEVVAASFFSSLPRVVRCTDRTPAD